jgi:lipoate-protein ligase B
MMTETARLLDLGRRDYRSTLQLQRALHAAVATDRAPQTWLVVEHPPVVTLGRNANEKNLLLGRGFLAAQNIDVVEVERGGDVTYHGPGQVVIYPIRKLERFRAIVPLVSAIEAAVIDALQTFGVAAHVRGEHRGVYVGDDAICAIGLAVKRMTSMHGLAFNASTELDYDRLITPCGTPEFGITSLAAQLGRDVSFAEARDALLDSLATTFDLRFEHEHVPAETALESLDPGLQGNGAGAGHAELQR